MMSSGLPRIVYAILTVGVIFCLTVTDMLILLPGGAHAQELLGGEVGYIGADQNVWLMNANGTEKRQVTSDATWEEDIDRGIKHRIWYGEIAWSPDGKQLAFIRSEFWRGDEGWREEYSLFLTDDKRQGLRKLVDDAHSFSWSPDGRTVAYVKSPCCWRGPEGRPLSDVDGIWAIDVSTGSTRLLVASQSGYSLVRPVWSPNGRYIAFHEASYEGYGPFTVADIQTGSQFPSSVGGFDWSPDGTQLVFDNVRYFEKEGQIWIANADGTGSYPLADDSGKLWVNPLWSPDGKTIAVQLSGFRLLPEEVGADIGVWMMNTNGTNRRQLTTFEGWPSSWSPDGTQLLVTASGGYIYSLNVDGTGLRKIAEGISPIWQPTPRVGLSDLLDQKQSSVEFLSGVGYDEQPSRELLERLKVRADEGEYLSPSDLSALQRLVLTEELLTGFYPHYARASADTGEAFASFVLILFGFVKAVRMVEARLPDNPFTRPAKALIAKMIEKLIDLINHGLQFLEYRVIPSELRPTFHNLRQLLSAYAKAHIMEPEDPFGPGGEALAQLISDPELGISRDDILLSGYRGRTQSLIDEAVLTADPDYPGPDPLVVLPPDARARLRMEWALTNVEHWSEYHRSNYQAFKEAANIPALAADVADLASLTGVLAPIAQVVARAADLMELLITGYGGHKSWQFLNCLEESAREAQARIYDTSLLLEIPPACERARKVGLLAPSTSVGSYTWPTVQPLARPQQESEEYQQLLEQVIAALEKEDRETLVDLVPQVLDADEVLSQALDLVTTPILATADDETSEQLFSQGVSFDVDIILLYAYLADSLLVPEEASFNAAQNQAHTVATGLDRYQHLIGTIQLAPAEQKPVPILLISSISLPEEITVDREFTVGVEVASVGGVPAREATLVASADEGMEPRETSAPLGDLEAESTRTVTLRLTPRQEGPSLLTLILSSQDGGSVSRLVLLEVKRGGGVPAVMATRSTSWPWLAGLGLLALTLVCLLALGWRVRRSRVMAPEAVVKLCPNCESRNVAAATFCVKCGRRLSGH